MPISASRQAVHSIYHSIYIYDGFRLMNLILIIIHIHSIFKYHISISYSLSYCPFKDILNLCTHFIYSFTYSFHILIHVLISYTHSGTHFIYSFMYSLYIYIYIYIYISQIELITDHNHILSSYHLCRSTRSLSIHSLLNWLSLVYSCISYHFLSFSGYM